MFQLFSNNLGSKRILFFYLLELLLFSFLILVSHNFGVMGFFLFRPENSSLHFHLLV